MNTSDQQNSNSPEAENVGNSESNKLSESMSDQIPEQNQKAHSSLLETDELEAQSVGSAAEFETVNEPSKENSPDVNTSPTPSKKDAEDKTTIPPEDSKTTESSEQTEATDSLSAIQAPTATSAPLEPPFDSAETKENFAAAEKPNEDGLINPVTNTENIEIKGAKPDVASTAPTSTTETQAISASNESNTGPTEPPQEGQNTESGSNDNLPEPQDSENKIIPPPNLVERKMLLIPSSIQKGTQEPSDYMLKFVFSLIQDPESPVYLMDININPELLPVRDPSLALDNSIQYTFPNSQVVTINTLNKNYTLSGSVKLITIGNGMGQFDNNRKNFYLDLELDLHEQKGLIIEGLFELVETTAR